MAAAVLTACSSTSATSPASTAAGGSTATSTGSSAAVVGSAPKGTVGTVLVAADGHTLYRLTTDTATTTTCTGSCAQIWPPLTVPAGTTPRAAAGLGGPIGTLTRPDGAHQVTYQGHPLYTYAPDTTTSDALGQGIEGVWFVVHPSGSAATTATTPTTAPSGRYGY